jgi:type IV secretory pathway protease TraF
MAAVPEACAMTRYGWIIATFVATLGAALSAFFHPLPKLIWNASASVPFGLYAVHPSGALHASALVMVRPPNALVRFLDGRHYLPSKVPMLTKPSAATASPSLSTGSRLATPSITTAAADRFPSGRGASASPTATCSS